MGKPDSSSTPPRMRCVLTRAWLPVCLPQLLAEDASRQKQHTDNVQGLLKVSQAKSTDLHMAPT